MTVDPFAHDDAAYVLGALSPTRRKEFEEHLASCVDCTRSVRELAGMPGLLARLDESVFTGVEELPPVPDTLLPQLLRNVRRERRRTRWVALTAAAVVAVAVLVTSLVVSLAGGSGPEDSHPVAQAMTQVDQDVLRATVSLQQVAWGTKLHLTCSYARSATSGPDDEGDGGGYGGAAPSYTLVVHTVDGDRQQVATWRAVPGRDLEIDGATDADRDQIRTVDVVEVLSGRSVLTLTVTS